jgi:hypothetical protein
MSKRGGGYYFDLREPNIGGRPVYRGYDAISKTEYLNQVFLSFNIIQPKKK